jgi:hypothetical protein
MKIESQGPTAACVYIHLEKMDLNLTHAYCLLFTKETFPEIDISQTVFLA